MAYKDDLNAFAEELAKRKKYTVLMIKITVVLAALFFVAATVFLVLDLVKSTSNEVGNNGGDAGGSSNTSAISVRLKEGDAIYMYVGENVSWRDKVSISEGAAIAGVDTSGLNMDKTGTYTVTYTVTDASGGRATLEVSVIVTKKEYSYGTLMSLIKNKSAELGITADMTKTSKVKKIYEYVHEYKFVDESNTPSIDRDNWQSDWIEEATRTLGKGSGDCYSYYSLSKAFFEYFGIEHVGIQRDNRNIDKKYGTHFWLVVNVGAVGSKGQWYYYDATRLKYKFSDGTGNACLITLDKLQSYYELNGEAQGYDFYAFAPKNYPTVSTTPLK